MATGAMNERARQAIAGTHFVDLHGRPSGRLSSVFVGREPRRDYTPVVRTATGNQAPEFEPQGSGSRNPTPGPSTLTGKLQGKLPILNRRRLTGRKRRRSSSASLEHDLFSNSKSPQSAGHHGPRPVPAVPLALHGSTPSLYDCTDTETRRRRRDEAVASQRSQDYGSEHFGTESPRRPVTLADQQGSRSDTSPANPSAGRNSRATLIRGVVPAASAARAKSARRLSRKPAAHMRDAEWTEEYEPAPADSVGVITLASTRERRIVLSVEDTTAASADISSAANDLADSSDGSDSDDIRSGYGDAAIARSISEDSSVSDINRSAGRRVMDSVVIERRISGQSLLRPLNTLRPVAFDPSEESGPDECDIPRSSREGPKTRQNSPIYLPFMPMNREARTFQREGAPEVMSHIGSGEGRPAGSTSSGVAGVAGPDEQGQIMRIDHVSSGSAGGSENTTNTSAIMHLPNDHRRDSNVNSTQADGANRAPAEIRGFVNRAVEHREQDTVRHRSPPIERQQPDRLATSVRGTTHGELRGTETRCASCRIPKRPVHAVHRNWRSMLAQSRHAPGEELMLNARAATLTCSTGGTTA
ncbi:hypothetical protein BDZ85DRAFT_138833 [Elsinoe ampelina]|uniref:Uncharacterized protein n=1 Tax=Elsinoe ampelina TaxID=302913 RepID=A0A6A6G950_9PEZI|nr:hypothetical protein BDZ85DRAFT_138833 [Elsinoe ampelina]